MNRMKKNVWLLSLCQALMNTGNVLLFATSSLVGYHLAGDKSLATLPLGLQFLGTMLTIMPASMIMKHTGRRPGFMVGSMFGISGAALASWAILHNAFFPFCVGAMLLGAFNGFGTYYRFAAADVATEEYRPAAISYVMAGGVIAAVVGPNLASWTSHLLSSGQFAGSYLALAGLYVASFLLVLFMDIPHTDHDAYDSGRSLWSIASQEKFVVAVMGAALGYGIMALVMTATPLAMQHNSHSFHDTAFVIEWHVLGMFAPSFFTGHLIRRFGVLNIMLAGVLLNVACVIVNLMGTELHHFWTALFLLGLGWNFLFVGGTSLLTETYCKEDKAKTQALNDLILFTIVAISSLSAGALHHLLGWRAVNLAVLAPIGLIFFALMWLILKPYVPTKNAEATAVE